MTSGNNQLPLLERAEAIVVTDWGKTLVVAPHQDDESLGCGGTIALLRQVGIPVEVVFTSDGSMSHPNSKEYPTDRLIALRETEALAALQCLGVNENAVHFMRLKDSQVSDQTAEGFAAAVEEFLKLLDQIQPQTVLVPWRRDPHKDHRASWQIVDAAKQQFALPLRRLEYLIWLWERGEADEFPHIGEASILRVNIETVAALKQQAIHQHLSQITRLINDDPEGFILSPEVLSHFNRDYELFVEMSN